MGSDADGRLRVTDRSTLRRKRDRGSQDRGFIDAILDEGLVCHVGFTLGGSTFVLPTAYVRIDDVLYLHGAAANGMLQTLATGIEACVTVTLLDGLVLARSFFHHSMNYRSVMLLGTASRVEDEFEQRAAVTALVDHVAPGRSHDARPPTVNELRATLVVRFPIEEGSAKIRSGGPIEDPEDLQLETWAGQIPLELVARAPVADEALLAGVEVPAYVRAYPSRRQPSVSPLTGSSGLRRHPEAGG